MRPELAVETTGTKARLPSLTPRGALATAEFDSPHDVTQDTKTPRPKDFIFGVPVQTDAPKPKLDRSKSGVDFSSLPGASLLIPDGVDIDGALDNVSPSDSAEKVMQEPPKNKRPHLAREPTLIEDEQKELLGKHFPLLLLFSPIYCGSIAKRRNTACSTCEETQAKHNRRGGRRQEQ
jgi:hypothetical protein